MFKRFLSAQWRPAFNASPASGGGSGKPAGRPKARGEGQETPSDSEEMTDEEEEEESEGQEDEEDESEEQEDEEEQQTQAASPRAATVRELRAALPAASAEQIERYATAGLTVAQARKVHVDPADQSGAAGKKGRKGRKIPATPGGPGVQAQAGEDEDVPVHGRHPFEIAAARRAKETGCTEREAKVQICSEQPALYADFRRQRYESKPAGRNGPVRRVLNRMA